MDTGFLTNARCTAKQTLSGLTQFTWFKKKKLLLFFPLSIRFSLDIDAAQFYTFFNCNVRLQNRCNPSKRENRQNGNKESSQEGTREEGGEEGRKEGREEKVAEDNLKGNTPRGTLQSVPLSVFAGKPVGDFAEG
jgi:hypothetical protein